MAKINSSLLNDFHIKEADTKKRLGKVFAAFVKVPIGGYFIVGGREAPFLFGNESFKCLCIGHSSLDISEGEDILRNVGSAISGTFSEEDLHALVVSSFTSRTMRLSLEDMELPRGIAAEFIVFDIGEKVLKVRYDGNVETEELNAMKNNFTIIGAYHPAFRRILLEELKRAPTDIVPKNYSERAEAIKKVALSIKRKLKLEHIGVIV